AGRALRVSLLAERRGEVASEFLDRNHTSKFMILASLLTPKFAPEASFEVWRTSESGHEPSGAATGSLHDVKEHGALRRRFPATAGTGPVGAGNARIMRPPWGCG